jgi:hypothetical protein
MANLLPQGKQQFETSAGVPLVGGKVYTYDAGTTNPRTTWQDAAGSQPNTNPIILDSRGEAIIFWSGNYKVVLKDSLDNTIWTVDNVSTVFGGLPQSLLPAADNTYDLGSTSFAWRNVYVGAGHAPIYDSVSGNVGYYSRTAAEIANSVNPVNFSYPPGNLLRYGTNTTPGTTDMSAALALANTVAAASSALSITIPNLAHVASPTTLTAPITDSMGQLFTSTSQITINNGQFVRPEWWGSGQNTIRFAVNALPTLGGVVQLEDKTYLSNGFGYGVGAATGVAITKSNVTLRGRKKPQLATDCKSLTGGTIIQGLVLVFADNFAALDLGVDNGFTVNGGVSPATAGDGLLLTYPDDTSKAANALRRGAHLHHVIGLCYGPNAPVHGVIAGEGYTDVVCTGEITGVYGLHGVVIKCSQVKAEQLTGYLNGTDGIIIKSDVPTTAVSNTIQIDRILSYANGPAGWSPYATPTTTTGTSNFGMLLHSFGIGISKIEIGEFMESGHTNGIKTQFDGAFVLDSLKIDSIITDANADAGVWLTASTAAGASMQRVQIGKIETRNTSTGVVFDWTTASSVKVGAIHAVNCTNAGIAATSNANPMIDTVTAENCGAAYQLTSTCKPLVGKTILTGTTTAYYQSSGSGLVPALSNSWAQVGGGDTFNVLLTHYGIEMNGLVSGGVTNVIMTLPSFARPPTEKRLMLQGRGGGGQAAIPVQVATTGVITINDAAGGIANVANYLSLAGLSFSLTN